MRVPTLSRRDLLSACALAACACHTKRSEARSVVLGVSLLRISLPVFVALEQGLFVKHGVHVDLRRFDTAQPLADELAAGRLDAGGYVAIPILFDPARASAHVRIFSAIVEDHSHRISYLLARKGSGISDVAALRGRKIGILPTLAYQRWLTAVLNHAGVPRDATAFVPLAPSLQVDALATGGVDALFTGDPMATAALVRGVGELVSATPEVPAALGDPFVFGTFAVGEAFSRTEPELAEALRRSIDEAIELLSRTPDVGLASMRSYVREPERPYIDHYPASRYLRSEELRPEVLGRALRAAESTRHATDVLWP